MSYGMCVGCEDAIKWVENLTGVDEEYRTRVLNRMNYEFDKDRPVIPKYRPGVYGKKYDSYTCGHCGFGATIIYHYCPNCGYAINWKDAHTREEYDRFRRLNKPLVKGEA